MDIVSQSITAVVCGELSLFLVFLYLYLLYRDRYLAMWALSWLMLILRVSLFDPAFVMPLSTHALIIFQLLFMGAGLTQVWGVYAFREEYFDKKWLYAAISVSLVSYLALLTAGQVSFFIFILPTAWLTGLMLLWTGREYLHLIVGIDKYLAGGVLILLGLHNFGFSFLVYFSVGTWGSLLAVTLQLIAMFGFLMFYLGESRRDQLSKERYYRLVGKNLMSREKYYRLIAENALDIIYRFQYKPNRGFEYVSSAVTNIIGYTPAEFYADPLLEMKIIHPDDLVALAEFRNKPAKLDRPAVFRLIHKNGTVIWTEQRGVPIYEDGTVIAFEGIIRDITPRKRMEQDMAKLEGLNAIGQMAANIAHEIRNPMTTVRGYLQLLGGKKEFNAFKNEFELLLSELDRTNAIITEYLALSKEKTAEFTTGQLNDVINAMLPLMQADANASTKSIRTKIRPLPDIQLNSKEIRQLILNLVRNGLEAMDSGGTLTIETGVNDKGVMLAVRDQGKGIPAEIMDKLGTPFFTTKKDGTGLGLAVCYRIAGRHGAMIEYETCSKGTDFYVYFPIPAAGAEI